MEQFGEMGRLPHPRGLDCERPGSFLQAHTISIRKISYSKAVQPWAFPTNTGWLSAATAGVARKGATASRSGREETSQEEAAAPLSAPRTRRQSCATGAPAQRTPPPRVSPRTQYYAAPDPSNCPRSPTTPPVPPAPAPIPTKFQEKLPPRARPVPDNRWAVAPAGLGLS